MDALRRGIFINFIYSADRRFSTLAATYDRPKQTNNAKNQGNYTSPQLAGILAVVAVTQGKVVVYKVDGVERGILAKQAVAGDKVFVKYSALEGKYLSF